APGWARFIPGPSFGSVVCYHIYKYYLRMHLGGVCCILRRAHAEATVFILEGNNDQLAVAEIGSISEEGDAVPYYMYLRSDMLQNITDKGSDILLYVKDSLC
ncbi:hypothetical protein ACJX0J_010587, partial [Zea mays]